ncbi:MAG: sulfite exporter TauE/SafE family protein [Salinisphaera sp.]|jgi:hypothetical protein|nr:sulfite exporter TauE/SafE family protein [Salinisphaera sp.]
MEYRYAMGLTGGGGSIFAVPLLIYGLGVPTPAAISLVAVALTSAAGAVEGLARGVVELRAALIFAAFFGVGGGFLIVPALVLITEMGIHRAVATSLLVITLIGLSGVLSAVVAGREIDWDTGGLVYCRRTDWHVRWPAAGASAGRCDAADAVCSRHAGNRRLHARESVGRQLNSNGCRSPKPRRAISLVDCSTLVR